MVISSSYGRPIRKRISAGTIVRRYGEEKQRQREKTAPRGLARIKILIVCAFENVHNLIDVLLHFRDVIGSQPAFDASIADVATFAAKHRQSILNRPAKVALSQPQQ